MTTIRRALLLACILASGAAAAAEESAGAGADWMTWRADDDVTNLASLQRGARNFMGYCLGCHSLKYERYSRLGEDLGLTPEELQQFLIAPGDKPADYILTTMPAGDAATWFGKTPPDLSLMARARGSDYLYQFLKTFYVDSSRPTGANNLRLAATAMPAVLSELEGLKSAVFRDEEE
jgi:ubiquinol-cytochrome c reductase cytochrome c1 subunit